MQRRLAVCRDRDDVNAGVALQCGFQLGDDRADITGLAHHAYRLARTQLAVDAVEVALLALRAKIDAETAPEPARGHGPENISHFCSMI